MAVAASTEQEEEQEEIAAGEVDTEGIVVELASAVAEFVAFVQDRPTVEEIVVVAAGVDVVKGLPDYLDVQLLDFEVVVE